MISFRIDRFALLAVQGTLKSLLQYHNWKASILWPSTFMAQLSHPYITTGKIIALSIRTFVGNVMSLIFNTLSRSITAFFLRSKRLLSSSLQSPSAVILELKKRKSVKLHFFSPSICHEVASPEFLPGESQGQGSLVGFRLWGRKESDTTEAT